MSPLIRWMCLLAVVMLSGMPPDTAFCFDTLRCANCIIKTGDHKSKVQQCCGEPTNKETIGEKVYRDAKEKVELTITEWTYDKYQYYIVVTFEGARVKKMENIYK